MKIATDEESYLLQIRQNQGCAVGQQPGMKLKKDLSHSTILSIIVSVQNMKAEEEKLAAPKMPRNTVSAKYHSAITLRLHKCVVDVEIVQWTKDWAEHVAWMNGSRWAYKIT